MSKPNNDHPPNESNLGKKPKKKLRAKPFSISLGPELRRDINQLNLPVSKICQQALKVAIKNELELRKELTKKKEDADHYAKVRAEAFESTSKKLAEQKELVLKEEQTTESKLQTEGVERLTKQMGEPTKKTVKDFYEECYEAGQLWASKEATVEELKNFFEEDEISDLFVIFYDKYDKGESIPEEILKSDEDDNQLFFSFHEGARDMWWEMKKILEGKGYEI